MSAKLIDGKLISAKVASPTAMINEQITRGIRPTKLRKGKPPLKGFFNAQSDPIMAWSRKNNVSEKITPTTIAAVNSRNNETP